MHKTCVFPFYLIYPLGGYNRGKNAPGDHESNFKKVGAIPCGCNSKWNIIVYKIKKNRADKEEKLLVWNLWALYYKSLWDSNWK